MNFEAIERLVIIITYSLLAVFIVCVIFVLLNSLHKSKKAVKNYKSSVIKLLKDKKAQMNLDIKDSIEFLYNHYSSHGGVLNFNDINSEIIAELRSGSPKLQNKFNFNATENDIQLFESLIKEIQDKYQFSDEKKGAILKAISQSKLKDDEKSQLTELLKNFLTSTFSYCEGRIFEKEQVISKLNFEIKEIKKKKMIKKVLGGIFTTIGIISSIITIAEFINIWFK